MVPYEYDHAGCVLLWFRLVWYSAASCAVIHVYLLMNPCASKNTCMLNLSCFLIRSDWFFWQHQRLTNLSLSQFFNTALPVFFSIMCTKSYRLSLIRHNYWYYLSPKKRPIDWSIGLVLNHRYQLVNACFFWRPQWKHKYVIGTPKSLLLRAFVGQRSNLFSWTIITFNMS